MAEPLHELSVERRIAAAPLTVWRVWTTRLAEWWCPPPWTARLDELDLRPGGRFAVVMSGPDGATMPLEGVILDAAPGERIVFSNAFTAGWVPHAPFMVALFTFTPDGGGTRYRAAARHWDAATMQHHEAMGFHTGWPLVAGQLAALAEAEEAAG